MTDAMCIGTIRCLAADIVAGANSGHPGAPLGMAPIAHVLFTRFLHFDGESPTWMNRDRFVLSNGHGCALLYSMLHLCGYDLPVEQLQRFRQLGSKTPGHPEALPGHPGIEVTTGPLGQGIGQGVGLALAQAHLAARFNKPGFEIFNNFTYVFCGDGCLQEGVSCEAVSLAGHLGLGKLIVVYDDNEITIDGPTSLSYSEKVSDKYQALNWHTVTVVDGNTDLEAMEKALNECRANTTQPSMILLKTTIGYGSKLQGTAKVHGAPLAADDIKQLKAKAGLDVDAKFQIGDDVKSTYGAAIKKNRSIKTEWDSLLAKYCGQFSEEGKELTQYLEGRLPAGWDSELPMSKEGESIATRKCSQNVLEAVLPKVGNMIGGSADLAPSNLTKTAGSEDIRPGDFIGRYIRFGVREHAMTAISNGISCFGKGVLIPFCATFFNFVTYAWGAVRVGALSECGTIHIATHDGIGVGEDGPTHQPIEIAALIRATPNILFFRPCDQTETTAAYIIAIETRNRTSILALSRQAVPMLTTSTVDNVRKGAYCCFGDVSTADVIIVSTGTEVSLAIDGAKLTEGLKVAVVSMPCTQLYDAQPASYKKSLFPQGTPVLGLEVYSSVGWERYCHYHMGMSTFGASAPAPQIYKHFGFTKENVAAKTKALV